ncbi:MAG: hypothetical protein LBK63_10960 [Treponema sp.]|jgi:hypothetical protein|nr:hypothetical protein [Treponema sp.]
MKRTLFFGVVFGCFFTVALFGADFYSVKSVAGQTHRLGPAGQWIPVFEGDILSSSVVIRTGQDAVLIVAAGNTERIIRSARQGTLESFLGSGASGGEGRISTGSRAFDTNVSSSVSGASNIPPFPVRPARPRGQESELDWAD